MVTSTARGGLLFLDNLALAATLSGGTWAKPLSNLIDPRLRGRPARCTLATDLAASQMLITLGRPQTITGLAIVDHTMPSDALFRITTYSDVAAGTVWQQTGWLEADEQAVPYEERAFDDDTFWTGKALLAGYPKLLLHLPDEPLWGEALRIELDARGATAGSFDLGYLSLGRPFEATWNYAHGRRLGATSRTLLDETPGGRLLADLRRTRRGTTVEFLDLTKAEAMRLYDAGMALGTTGPALWVPAPDDVINRQRESKLVTLKDLAEPVEGDAPDSWTVTLNMQEVLG